MQYNYEVIGDQSTWCNACSINPSTAGVLGLQVSKYAFTCNTRKIRCTKIHHKYIDPDDCEMLHYLH